ncbi:hypothetical protein BV195_00651A, partial [Haemophilus influenzae]
MVKIVHLPVNIF